MNIDQFAELYRLKVRKDADGSKIISGEFGHIYEYGEGSFGVMVMPNPPRKQYWGHTKAAFLSLHLHIVQDGEGAATFSPTNAEQVKQAVRAAGIKHIRTVSPEVVQRLAQLILYA